MIYGQSHLRVFLMTSSHKGQIFWSVKQPNQECGLLAARSLVQERLPVSPWESYFLPRCFATAPIGDLAVWESYILVIQSKCHHCNSVDLGLVQVSSEERRILTAIKRIWNVRVQRLIVIPLRAFWILLFRFLDEPWKWPPDTCKQPSSVRFFLHWVMGCITGCSSERNCFKWSIIGEEKQPFHSIYKLHYQGKHAFLLMGPFKHRQIGNTFSTVAHLSYCLLQWAQLEKTL